MKSRLALALGVLLVGTLHLWATDLAVNGNFSAGNSGFSTDYTQVPANGTVFTQPGQYGLTTNPSTGFTNGFTSFTDHTGDAAGLMMLVDGNGAGHDIWSEVINVSPNTSYSFEAWVASANDLNTTTLGLFVDGVQVGSSFSAPTTSGQWSFWGDTVLTGSGVTQITLSIQDLNPTPLVAGNDFALDDIALNSPNTGVPEPATMLLLGSGLSALGLARLKGFRG